MSGRNRVKSCSNVFSDNSSFDSTPYPKDIRPSLAHIFTRLDLSAHPQQWGDMPYAFDSVGLDDEPEALPMRTCNQKIFSTVSLRRLANCVCLVGLIAGLLVLFIGYPVITFYDRKTLSTNGAYNIGGQNASGQVPLIPGNFGLIDNDTPHNVYTKASWLDPSNEMTLVFSDEFNTDGRSFYPGDDPYWEAADLHYWATNNLEWYDPEAVTTANGSLVVTLSKKRTHDLNYEGGMINTWNKFCFTGGYIEASVVLPGANNVMGLWPAIWTMGNLGRAGYGATLEGLWPYSYDSCDVGTVANQTVMGQPVAATVNGDPSRGGVLSYLPGQRLSRCTCQGENHPGPKHTDGTYVGRSAPEIDIFEAQIAGGPRAEVSQSAQWAPFNAGYIWLNTSANMVVSNPNISQLNSFIGTATQQATSVVTNTDTSAYEDNGGAFGVYGFEYKPGFDHAYITWISSNEIAWTFNAAGMGADPSVEISARPVAQEPMYIIVNLGMSEGFGFVDFSHLSFPVHMRVDYIRVYQLSDSINIGCNPKDFPTTEYINTYIDAYSNPNLTTWVDDYKQPFPKNSFLGQC